MGLFTWGDGKTKLSVLMCRDVGLCALRRKYAHLFSQFAGDFLWSDRTLHNQFVLKLFLTSSCSTTTVFPFVSDSDSSELINLLLTGEDQSQADQPNNLAEGHPMLSNLVDQSLAIESLMGAALCETTPAAVLANKREKDNNVGECFTCTSTDKRRTHIGPRGAVFHIIVRPVCKLSLMNCLVLSMYHEGALVKG